MAGNKTSRRDHLNDDHTTIWNKRSRRIQLARLSSREFVARYFSSRVKNLPCLGTIVIWRYQKIELKLLILLINSQMTRKYKTEKADQIK